MSLDRRARAARAVAGRPLDVRRQERERATSSTPARTSSPARADLGYAPRTDLEAGLRAELDWVAEHEWEELKPVAHAVSTS